jgi:outer membrane protein OmpA-like peptidoglycan-associated protein
VEVALVGAVMALILLVHGPREEVIVLPDAQGRTGTVVVERGAERIVLDQPYATSRISFDGAIRLERTEPQQVEKTFEPVLAALPARPRSFLLYFVTGTDTLTEASKVEFARMLEDLARRPGGDIVVIGHTDRQGAVEKNDELSLQRAERVKADLTNFGIPAELIRAAGRGEREPVVPTDDGVDEPLNRRVEINVR